MSRTAKLGALQRRLTYLEGRITARHGNANLAWPEYAAMRWALPILADVVARGAERGEDVHHQRRDSAYALLANTTTEALAELQPELAANLLASCGDDHVAGKVLQAIDRRNPGLAWRLRAAGADQAQAVAQ